MRRAPAQPWGPAPGCSAPRIRKAWGWAGQAGGVQGRGKESASLEGTVAALEVGAFRDID